VERPRAELEVRQQAVAVNENGRVRLDGEEERRVGGRVTANARIRLDAGVACHAERLAIGANAVVVHRAAGSERHANAAGAARRGRAVIVALAVRAHEADRAVASMHALRQVDARAAVSARLIQAALQRSQVVVASQCARIEDQAARACHDVEVAARMAHDEQAGVGRVRDDLVRFSVGAERLSRQSLSADRSKDARSSGLLGRGSLLLLLLLLRHRLDLLLL